ncbi:SMI1/KNR4 family protein [Phenylobacterium aquaticum]|uniref:SMI1/KNR4 family protein n=1 Tax=Phenylobacterium aquaticum TaxID=1763816 RepID=UPI001F5DA24E|nr:SMI1/KNR4 family protein [Phenylobacterium aquaticum]MCI3132632.1 SMI1/KNR4 family protein [Phenylobacterium aquaticum]
MAAADDAASALEFQLRFVAPGSLALGYNLAMLEHREWLALPGAKLGVLEELGRAAPVDLPDCYFALLAESNGGEGPLSVNPFNLCLDAAEQVVETIRSGNYGQADLAGFLIFGGNGGGEYLAFDIRGAAPWPIVSIDMVAGGGSAQRVAPDFEAFSELIGREPSN